MTVGELAAALIAFAIVTGGCSREQQVHPALVLHLQSLPGREYSRNDKYLGVRSPEELEASRERYTESLSLKVRSTDIQRTINGRPYDYYSTITRIESK